MCFAYELYSAATRTSTDSAYDVRSEGERVGVSYISTWLGRHTERREREMGLVWALGLGTPPRRSRHGYFYLDGCCWVAGSSFGIGISSSNFLPFMYAWYFDWITYHLVFYLQLCFPALWTLRLVRVLLLLPAAPSSFLRTVALLHAAHCPSLSEFYDFFSWTSATPPQPQHNTHKWALRVSEWEEQI